MSVSIVFFFQNPVKVWFTLSNRKHHVELDLKLLKAPTFGVWRPEWSDMVWLTCWGEWITAIRRQRSNKAMWEGIMMPDYIFSSSFNPNRIIKTMELEFYTFSESIQCLLCLSDCHPESSITHVAKKTMSICLSIHFNPDWNISTTFGWKSVKFSAGMND